MKIAIVGSRNIVTIDIGKYVSNDDEKKKNKGMRQKQKRAFVGFGGAAQTGDS